MAAHAMTLRGSPACVVGWVLAAAVSVPAAEAATVEVVSPGGTDYVRYIAAPGERNEVTFTGVAGSTLAAFRINDPGAAIRVGARCASEDVHTAVCTSTSFALDIRARLGDADDVFHLMGFTLTRINGGPGDDLLVGGTWDDRLDGGGGADELRGGEGADVLSDGDRDDARAGGVPGPDVLDGGPGADKVTYRQRMRAVSVNLADGRPDGARNERDLVLAVESVTGGDGNDRLIGDSAANTLDGRGGRNRLIGRSGDDVLFRPSTSIVSCAAGHDIVYAPRVSTLIPRTCERLGLPLPRRVFSDDTHLDLFPYPQRKGARRGFHVDCPQIDGEPLTCSAAVRIRERSTRRLLARGRIPQGAPYATRFLRLRFTPLGRLFLMGDRHGLAIVRIRGTSLPTTGWTIRF
jgi:hypothetical protein